jgi:glucokinase
MGYALGIDIGGTGCKGAVISSEGQIVRRAEIPTDPKNGTGTLLSLIAQLLDGAEQPVEAIGVGAAGFVNQSDGSVTFSPNLEYGDPEVARAVAKRFSLPVTVANDANAAAWGEMSVGAARGCSHVALITLGTGVGGGFIVDGRLLTGATGAGAELGHMVIDPDGPPCNCGLSGCVEQFVSGTAIARMAVETLDRSPDSSIRDFAAGEEVTSLHVARAAREWDEAAIEVLRRAGRYLGITMSNIVNIFDPQVIVIGGGVADAGEPFLGPARDQLSAMLNLQRRRPARLDRALLGNDAGIVGAALLALTGPEAWQG